MFALKKKMVVGCLSSSDFVWLRSFDLRRAAKETRRLRVPNHALIILFIYDHNINITDKLYFHISKQSKGKDKT